ncbi:hypothetical protein [Oenococcus sicerae]|uniref:hypothetical protein n=1 Tax=Oenococcus sicerae TaxID=2203724 RepID=UPI0039E8A30F
MQKLTLKRRYLAASVKLLADLADSGNMNAKEARAVKYLLKDISPKQQEVQEITKDLVEKHDGKYDKNSAPYFKSDEISKAFYKDFFDALDETITLTTSYDQEFDILKNFFDNYAGILPKGNRVGFDVFTDALEKG